MSTELESLVVTLGGNNSDLLRMYREAEAATKAAVGNIAAEAEKVAQSFQRQAETFGMTGRAAQLYGLELAGATEEQLAAASAADEQLTALEQQAALMSQGEQVTRSVETASEAYAREMESLNELLSAGAIDQETFNRAAERAAPAVQATTEQINQMGMAMTATGAALTAAFGGSAWQAFDEFSTRESIAIKLTAALEANGREVQSVIEDYRDFASELQRTTTAEDDATLALLKQAESFSLTGAAAKKSVMDAMAMAAFGDASAEATMRITTALAQGDTERAMLFSKMIPQLKGVKNETEFLAKYATLVASGEKVMAEEAKTAAGMIKQLKNEFGDFLEDIGKFIAEGLIPIVSFLKQMVGWLQSVPGPVKAAMATFLGLGTALGAVLTAAGASILVYNNLIVTTIQYITRTNAATAATLGFKTALVLGVAVAAYYAGKAILNYAGDMDHLNESLEKSVKLSDQWVARFTKGTQEIVGKAGRIATPEGQDSFLKGQLDLAKKDLADYTRLAESSQKRLDELAGVKWGLGRPDFLAAEAEMQQHQASLQTSKARVDELSKAYEALRNPKQNPALLRDIEELTKSLELEAATVGMTETAAKVYALEMRNATAAMLANVQAAADKVEAAKADAKTDEEAAERAKKLSEEISGLTESLQAEIATWGMGSDAAKLYQLSLDGATEAELAAARAASAVKTELEEVKAMLAEDPIGNFGPAMEKLEEMLAANTINFDAFSATVESANKEIAKAGKQVTKEAATPLEKYNQKIKELDILLGAGAISEGTFGNAMKAAKDDLDKAAKGAKGAKDEISKFDAALVGSQEDAARLSAYHDTLRESGKQAAKSLAGVPGVQVPGVQVPKVPVPEVPVVPMLADVEKVKAQLDDMRRVELLMTADLTKVKEQIEAARHVELVVNRQAPRIPQHGDLPPDKGGEPVPVVVQQAGAAQGAGGNDHDVLVAILEVLRAIEKKPGKPLEGANFI